MADNKEQIILDVKIEEGSAFQDLEKLKASMVNLKAEQTNLQKAYKSGHITLEEYSKEIVRVEALSKKQSAAYNEVQRSVTGLKNPIKELTKAQTDLAAQLKNSTESINVHGVSVGSLTTKFAQFATPVGAALGLVTALGSVYASSTIGAKDLEFAQNELGFAFQGVSNTLGKLISNGKDGEGVITKLTDVSLKLASNAVTGGVSSDFFGQKQAHEAAIAVEDLQDKERELILLRAEGTDRLVDNQDLLTKINDSQTSYGEKVKAMALIEQNLQKNKDEQLNNLDGQIALLTKQQGLVKDDEALEQKLNEKVAERSQLEKGINRLLQSNARLASNQADAAEKENQARKELFERLNPKNIKKDLSTDTSEFSDNETPFQIEARKNREAQAQELEDQKAFNEIFGQQQTIAYTASDEAARKHAESQKEFDDIVLENKIQNQLMIADSAASAATAASNLFGKNKFLARAAAIINTYAAAAAALAPPPIGVGPVAGPFLAASAIINGLSSVAKINNVQFSSGGYTGPGGKYQPAGVVHAGEVVWSQADVAMAGGPGRANSMRPTYNGYAEGGIVAKGMTGSTTVQQQIKTPPIYVSFKEMGEFEQRLKYKENTVTA